MPFEPGKPKTGGKKKGVQNKATIEFKEAVNNLISFATPQMVNWLEVVAQDDPNKALDHVYKFAQFGYPLLSRTALTGPDEGAIQHQVTITPELIAAERAAIDEQYGSLPQGLDKTPV